MNPELKNIDTTVVREFNLEKTTITYRADGIVEVLIKTNEILELEDINEQMEITKKYHAPDGDLVLIIPQIGSSSTKEVREVSNKPEVKKLIKAQAIVVNNLPHRIVINFMVKLIKNSYPFKTFENKEVAAKWLLDQK